MNKKMKVFLYATVAFTLLTFTQRVYAQAMESHNLVGGHNSVTAFVNGLGNTGLVLDDAARQNNQVQIMDIISAITKEEYRNLGIWYRVNNQTEEEQLAAWKGRCQECFAKLAAFQPNADSFVKLSRGIPGPYKKDFALQSIGLSADAYEYMATQQPPQSSCSVGILERSILAYAHPSLAPVFRELDRVQQRRLLQIQALIVFNKAGGFRQYVTVPQNAAKFVFDIQAVQNAVNPDEKWRIYKEQIAYGIARSILPKGVDEELIRSVVAAITEKFNEHLREMLLETETLVRDPFIEAIETEYNQGFRLGKEFRAPLPRLTYNILMERVRNDGQENGFFTLGEFNLEISPTSREFLRINLPTFLAAHPELSDSAFDVKQEYNVLKLSHRLWVDGTPKRHHIHMQLHGHPVDHPRMDQIMRDVGEAAEEEDNGFLHQELDPHPQTLTFAQISALNERNDYRFPYAHRYENGDDVELVFKADPDSLAVFTCVYREINGVPFDRATDAHTTTPLTFNDVEEVDGIKHYNYSHPRNIYQNGSRRYPIFLRICNVTAQVRVEQRQAQEEQLRARAAAMRQAAADSQRVREYEAWLAAVEEQQATEARLQEEARQAEAARVAEREYHEWYAEQARIAQQAADERNLHLWLASMSTADRNAVIEGIEDVERNRYFVWLFGLTDEQISAHVRYQVVVNRG